MALPKTESGDVFHLDRNESAFFTRELEVVKTRTYDAKLKELKALLFIPINTTAGNGITQITFRRYTAVGFAKIIADYAGDFSRVDVYGEEDSVKVIPIGVSYGYNIKEIRESIRSGKNLDGRRAASARRAIDQKINEIALFSSAKEGTRGIVDYPGITEVTLPADGSGGSKSWKTKTVDQVLRDINIITDGIMVPTNGIEVPDTMLVPLEIYNFLANTRLGDNVTTLLKYILDNNPHIKRIDWLTEQFAEQIKGMEYTIPCHAETAGVIVYYPMAFCYADMAA